MIRLSDWALIGLAAVAAIGFVVCIIVPPVAKLLRELKTKAMTLLISSGLFLTAGIWLFIWWVYTANSTVRAEIIKMSDTVSDLRTEVNSDVRSVLDALQSRDRLAKLQLDLDNQDGLSTSLNPNEKTERALDEYVRPWMFESGANWHVIKERALERAGIHKNDLSHEDRYETLRRALIDHLNARKRELENRSRLPSQLATDASD